MTETFFDIVDNELFSRAVDKNADKIVKRIVDIVNNVTFYNCLSYSCWQNNRHNLWQTVDRSGKRTTDNMSTKLSTYFSTKLSTYFSAKLSTKCSTTQSKFPKVFEKVFTRDWQQSQKFF